MTFSIKTSFFIQNNQKGFFGRTPWFGKKRHSFQGRHNVQHNDTQNNDARITTFSIMTLSTTTFSIKTSTGKKRHSFKGRHDVQHNNTQNNDARITTLSIMTLSTMTLSIKTSFFIQNNQKVVFSVGRLDLAKNDIHSRGAMTFSITTLRITTLA